jgi:16S rRNA (guanine966-N2)-methyltransferase
MRIISGKFRGRRIDPPMKKWPTRPTMDQSREALFNVLANHIDFANLTVLDLFGGTGIVSLEFISRGCSNVLLVERYGPAVNFIKETCLRLQITSELKVIKMDAIRFLNQTKAKYDLIFMDPPYDFPFYEKLVRLVFENDLLNPDALLIIEHDSSVDYSALSRLVDIRKYGESHFSFFK